MPVPMPWCHLWHHTLVVFQAKMVNLLGVFSLGAQRSVLIILLLTQGSNIFWGGGTDKGYDLPIITLWRPWQSWEQNQASRVAVLLFCCATGGFMTHTSSSKQSCLLDTTVISRLLPEPFYTSGYDPSWLHLYKSSKIGGMARCRVGWPPVLRRLSKFGSHSRASLCRESLHSL